MAVVGMVIAFEIFVPFVVLSLLSPGRHERECSSDYVSRNAIRFLSLTAALGVRGSNTVWLFGEATEK
jgi:hypothetical protein